jgi:uncharacterized protein
LRPVASTNYHATKGEEEVASMADDPLQQIAALLAPMVKKRLWVVLSTAKVPSAAMEPHAAEHLKYMAGIEEKGQLWASGPFIVPGVTVGDGLTIFNVPDKADVDRLMEDEPLTKLGMRTYEVRKWELREGRISIGLLCSQSNFTLV